MQQGASRPGIRTDIQVLRGLAVLLVLFYHAGIGGVTGGYLGVDIFFVISGFLITGIIKRGLEGSSFRFSEFYVRRARRLLPAAYVTFLVTALLAPMLIASSELQDFKAQLVGAVAFVANIVLWQQSDYFSGAAELKPLLHIWSLSIEEQYYFVLPALMYFIPRRYWRPAAYAIVLGSLALCLFTVSRHASATFYFLPTRAWELGIGSVGALATVGAIQQQVLRVAFWPSIVVLAVIPFYPMGNFHPGPDALIVCIATLVVILRAHPLFERTRLARIPARVGDISYSLYLVHWPLFAFLNNAWAGSSEEAPLAWRAGLLTASLALGYALNRFVEEPFRHLEVRKAPKFLAQTAAVSTLLIAAAFAVAQPGLATTEYGDERRANHGLAKECAQSGNFRIIEACSTSPDPSMLLWGDSYMMHLVPGIVAASKSELGVMQATMSACAPTEGMARLQYRAGYGPSFVSRCLNFNDSVLDYIAKTESIEVVVISAAFAGYVNPADHTMSVRRSDGSMSQEPLGVDVALVGIQSSVAAVRQMGRKVVVVSPPPSAGFDSSRCLERQAAGLMILPNGSDCQIHQEAYHRTAGATFELLSRLKAEADVDVIHLAEFLCERDTCVTSINGHALYRDAGHLSYAGSTLIARRANLVEQIHRLAR